MQVVARRFDTKETVRLTWSAGQITEEAVVDVSTADVPWVAPGLIDLQVNGYGGQEFSSTNIAVEAVSRIACQMTAFGVTRFCPTVTTASVDVLRHSLATIAKACRESVELANRIIGIHLEGPYISPSDGPRGAHPRMHCRRPDWDEFRHLQDAAEGRISVLTLSVDFTNAASFIERVVQSGVLVGIGHTAANSDQIRIATDAGARLSTHLGNGAHSVLPRHPNYLWDQLAEDRLSAGLIVDGHHLPPSVVKTFVRAKTPQRCVLVSDMAGQAGLAPGRYRGGLSDVEILPSGRLVIAGQKDLLAGATSPIGLGVANVVRFAEVELSTAIAMATERPAELLGISPGRIESGAPADFVLFTLGDTSFDVVATIASGEVAAGALPDLAIP